ncbi:hypothetical protein D3C72_1898970 [compost metagenome]
MLRRRAVRQLEHDRHQRLEARLEQVGGRIGVADAVAVHLHGGVGVAQGLRQQLVLVGALDRNVRERQVACVGQAHEVARHLQGRPLRKVRQLHAIGLGQGVGASLGICRIRGIGRIAGAAAAAIRQAGKERRRQVVLVAGVCQLL